MSDKLKLNRRNFVRFIAVTTSAYPLSSLALNSSKKLKSITNKNDPWLTLNAALEHLFPQQNDHSPSAKSINALSYLQTTMHRSDFDKSDFELIHNGVGWLNDLSLQNYSKKFSYLDTVSKENLLRTIEKSRVGSRWLSLLLTYVIQALLTDPVYGGNPNEIGWEWLQHKPGFPRPPANKTYYNISKNRYRNTKA